MPDFCIFSTGMPAFFISSRIRSTAFSTFHSVIFQPSLLTDCSRHFGAEFHVFADLSSTNFVLSCAESVPVMKFGTAKIELVSDRRVFIYEKV